MREYGKIFSRIWESADFRALSEDGRTLVLYLLSCQHGTIAGVFRVPDGYACEDLQWTPERVSEGFRNLSSKGFATRCEVTKWVWVHKYLEWNQPENPNQWKAVHKCAALVPGSCAWRADFTRALASVHGGESAAEANPSPTVQQPFRNQEQEQEQEQEKDNKPAKAGTPSVPCPVERIVAIYHEALPDLPAVRLTSEKRTKAIRGFWAWVLTSRKSDGSPRATNGEEALAWVKGYFERAAQNDWLMGRTPRSGDHANWTADLDFLLTDKGKKHVIEKTREAA